MSNINEQIKEKLEKSGKITSQDVAAFSVPSAEESEDKRLEDALAEDTETALARTPDPIVDRARKDTLGKSSNKSIVTAKDKAAFLAALVANARFTRDYTALGGAVQLTLRSKTVAESSAVTQRFAKEARDNLLMTSVEQTNRLRSMLMVFQVAELNGVAYEPPAAPLLPTVSDAGKADPAWIARADEWQNCSDSLHTVIWQCIADFEDRYWTMVEQARSSDFWQPEESI